MKRTFDDESVGGEVTQDQRKVDHLKQESKQRDKHNNLTLHAPLHDLSCSGREKKQQGAGRAGGQRCSWAQAGRQAVSK